MSRKSALYILLWRNKHLTTEAESLEDMAAKLTAAAGELAAMVRTGKVRLLPDGVEADYAKLVTDDEATAERFGFQDAEDYDPDQLPDADFDDEFGEDDTDLYDSD